MNKRVDPYYPSRIGSPEEQNREVFDVLEIDRAHRYKGITNDLWRFSEIMPVLTWRTWSGTLPQLQFNNHNNFADFINPRTPYLNSESLYEYIYPYEDVRSFTRKMFARGFIFAGNYLTRMITGYAQGIRRPLNNALEFYIVGKDEAWIRHHVNAAIQEFTVDKLVRYKNLIWVRSKNENVEYGQPEMIIHLDKYDTISELVHSMSCGSRAMAWDGKEIYLSTLGKFALQRGVNIFDITRYNDDHYNMDISTALSNNFALIVPNLLLDESSEPDLNFFKAHGLVNGTIWKGALWWEDLGTPPDNDDIIHGKEDIKYLHAFATTSDRIDVFDMPLDLPTPDDIIDGIYNRIRHLNAVHVQSLWDVVGKELTGRLLSGQFISEEEIAQAYKNMLGPYSDYIFTFEWIPNPLPEVGETMLPKVSEKEVYQELYVP